MVGRPGPAAPAYQETSSSPSAVPSLTTSISGTPTVTGLGRSCNGKYMSERCTAEQPASSSAYARASVPTILLVHIMMSRPAMPP